MKIANQLTFATQEASLSLKSNNPIKAVFDNVDFSFIHQLVKDKNSPLGAEGYGPISLYSAQLLIYIGEVIPTGKSVTMV